MHALLKFFFWVATILTAFPALSQYNPQFYLRNTEAAEREKTLERIVNNTILKNLSSPLNEETEESWENAFIAMEIVDYKDAITRNKLQDALTQITNYSLSFQRQVLETAYTLYPDQFIPEIKTFMQSTTDPKMFAMGAVCLSKNSDIHNEFILEQMQATFADSALTHPILARLAYQLQNKSDPYIHILQILQTVFSKDFLPGQTILYSLQRKNRDYPGMVLIRKGDGSFVKTGDGYFHVPQLARGIANLPYFLTKGNTPQGLHRMFGFGVSQNRFIGPTANIQMGMPAELSKNKFFDLNNRNSTDWKKEDYARLLPENVRNFESLYESFYAGLAGRNEIIAHGTTVNPEYYKHQPYYPLTPTEGCLCTKEIWDGKIIESDQQKLVNALLSAGGAHGYVLVLEIDAKEKPVSVEDVTEFLP